MTHHVFEPDAGAKLDRTDVRAVLPQIRSRCRQPGALLVAVVGTGLGLYTLLLLLTEDLYTQKGTYAYYVTISSPTIKYFPRIQLTEEEEYYSSCGDGPKLPANGIRYDSTEKPDVLKQTIEAYLLERGFIKEADEIHGGEYAQPGSKISLYLMIMPEVNGVQRVVATESYGWD